MRCNAGVDPAILADQHLIAEYRELLIPAGQMIKFGWKSKAPIPTKLSLGKGHVTFWRDKQLYLKRRHNALVAEMVKRGFKPNLSYWDLDQIPSEFLNDWEAGVEDSKLLRERIYDRVVQKFDWYRYNKGRLPKNYKEMLFSSPVKY